MAFGDAPQPTPLSIAAGGRMRERIAADPFGIDCWDQSARIRCFVTLIDAEEWPAVTGIPLPMPPFTPADYEKEGLPWFEYDNDGLPALGGASDVAEVKSVQDINDASGLTSLEANRAIERHEVLPLRPVRPPRRSRHPSPIVRTYWTVHNRLLNR